MNTIKHRIDGLKSTLICDTVKYELVFFNINAFGDKAFGCHVVLNQNGVVSESFKLGIGMINKYTTPKRPLKNCMSIIKDFFYYPDRFIEKVNPKNVIHLSHDNEIYLFLKASNKVLLNDYTMRSAILSESSEKFKTIIRELGSLY